jgi:hypothetical protein
MVEWATIVPSVLLGILVIVLIVFIIKSLIKFAIFVAAVALLVFLLWTFGVFDRIIPGWVAPRDWATWWSLLSLRS